MAWRARLFFMGQLHRMREVFRVRRGRRHPLWIVGLLKRIGSRYSSRLSRCRVWISVARQARKSIRSLITRRAWRGLWLTKVMERNTRHLGYLCQTRRWSKAMNTWQMPRELAQKDTTGTKCFFRSLNKVRSHSHSIRQSVTAQSIQDPWGCLTRHQIVELETARIEWTCLRWAPPPSRPRTQRTS